MKILILIILSIFLVPTFNIAGIPIRIEDLFFIGIIVAAPKNSLIKLLRNPKAKVFITILTLYLVSSLVSFFISVFNGYSPILQDYNSIFNLLRILIILCAGLILGKSLKIPANRLLLILTAGTFFSAFFSIIQYFNLFGIGEKLYVVYGNEKFVANGVSRAIGSIGNPNYASFFQLIGFIVLLILKWPQKSFLKVLRILLLGIIFLSVFVTFSRTGLITAVLIVITYLYLKGNLKLAFFYTFIFFFIAIYVSPMFSETRYSQVISSTGSVDLTLNGRVNLIWEEKIKGFLENPIWGEGTREGALSETIFSVRTFDNGFLYLLVTKGIVGTIIYLSFFFYELKYFKRLKNTPFHPLYLFVILFNLTVLIYFITTDMPKAVIFMTYFYFMIGLLLTYTQRFSKIKKALHVSSCKHNDSKLE